ncbi:hypothetical protein ACFU51_19035 [Streptomyces sp. NPDC057430]|uniref:hypothetical protein n=1 Tax=Streptomyces sp. NPDC057430 TaxID=3346131 RepID=UPI0036B24BA2
MSRSMMRLRTVEECGSKSGTSSRRAQRGGARGLLAACRSIGAPVDVPLNDALAAATDPVRTRYGPGTDPVRTRYGPGTDPVRTRYGPARTSRPRGRPGTSSARS